MSDLQNRTAGDKPTDYHEHLRASRTKLDPFVYPAKNSTKKVRFTMPLQLPARRSVVVGAWLRRLELGDELGMWETVLDALTAWVGEEGVRTMVDEDGLTLEDLVNVMMEAGNAYQQTAGTEGESPASTS